MRWYEIFFSLTRYYELKFSIKNAIMLNLLREGFVNHYGHTRLEVLVSAVMRKGYPIQTKKYESHIKLMRSI